MKKWLIGLLLVLVLATAAVYIFIPSEIRVRKVMVIRANEKGIYPFIQSIEGIAKWWPEKKTTGSNFIFGNGNYTFAEPMLHGMKISIAKSSNNFNSEIQVAALAIDSLEIVWSTSFSAGINPLSRITAYNNAAAVKKDMESILLQLKNFLEKMENIYGIKVERSKIKDTLMVVAETATTGIPGNTIIYGLVQQLETYIAAGGAAATNVPMLNIFTADSIHFKTMVAIPVSKELPETALFKTKRMIPGNVLVADVKGGAAAIQQSLKQLDNYRLNYNYTAPAKPFQSLITNRLTEADSTKWITKLYWPVF
jgi:hypothetical protein